MRSRRGDSVAGRIETSPAKPVEREPVAYAHFTLCERGTTGCWLSTYPLPELKTNPAPFRPGYAFLRAGAWAVV